MEKEEGGGPGTLADLIDRSGDRQTRLRLGGRIHPTEFQPKVGDLSIFTTSLNTLYPVTTLYMTLYKKQSPKLFSCSKTRVSLNLVQNIFLSLYMSSLYLNSSNAEKASLSAIFIL